MRARPKYYQRKHILLRQLDLEKAFYKNKITFKDNAIDRKSTIFKIRDGAYEYLN